MARLWRGTYLFFSQIGIWTKERCACWIPLVWLLDPQATHLLWPVLRSPANRSTFAGFSWKPDHETNQTDLNTQRPKQPDAWEQPRKRHTLCGRLARKAKKTKNKNNSDALRRRTLAHAEQGLAAPDRSESIAWKVWAFQPAQRLQFG